MPEPLVAKLELLVVPTPKLKPPVPVLALVDRLNAGGVADCCVAIGFVGCMPLLNENEEAGFIPVDC